MFSSSHQSVVVDECRSDVGDFTRRELLLVKGEEVAGDEVVDDGIAEELKSNHRMFDEIIWDFQFWV